jgi:hypothetical protein
LMAGFFQKKAVEGVFGSGPAYAPPWLIAAMSKPFQRWANPRDR